MYLVDSQREQRAVYAGEAWLDEYIPGWWQRGKIALTTLNVAGSWCCPLAQATGVDFNDAVARHELTIAEQVGYGFLAPSGTCRDTYYANLTYYWKEVIRRRRRVHTSRRRKPRHQSVSTGHFVIERVAA